MLWTQTTGSVGSGRRIHLCVIITRQWICLKIDDILIVVFKNKRKELQVGEAVWTRAWRRRGVNES